MQGILHFIKHTIGRNSSDLVYFMIFHLFSPDKSDCTLFYNSIYHNLFIDEIKRQHLMEIFFKACIYKYRLKRFVQNYIWKRTAHVDIKKDMYGNLLDSFKDNQKITILDNDKKYIFRLTDLLTIWMNSLTNSRYFFCKPIPFCNPYTGVKFGKHNQYNIYFALHNSTYHVPALLMDFFYAELDIDEFKISNYPKLQDYAIKNYYKNASEEEKYDDIIQMLSLYTSISSELLLRQIIPEKRKIFNEIFDEFLFFYYYYQYGQNNLLKNVYLDRLKTDLPKHVTQHPIDWNMMTLPRPPPPPISTIGPII